MKFKELIAKHTWEEIKPRIRDLYFSEKNIESHYTDFSNGDKLVKTMEDMDIYAKDQLIGYEYVFNTLLVKKPRKNKDKKAWKVFVKYVDKVDDGSPMELPYYDVYGENGEKNSDDENLMGFYKEKIDNGTIDSETLKHLNSNTTFAMEFTCWSNWLDMEVDDVSLNICGEAIFISCCLWEMTWCGFTEERVRSKKTKLDKTFKKAKQDIAAGKYKTYNSVDEMFEDMKSRITRIKE